MSSSRNAIVTTPSGPNSHIINLGPIDSEVVGERVEFKFLGSHWGKCLTEKYIYEGYSPHDETTTSGSSNRSKPTGSVAPNPYQFTTVNSKNGLLNDENTDS